jgi:hypothetical protein
VPRAAAPGFIKGSAVLGTHRPHAEERAQARVAKHGQQL